MKIGQQVTVLGETAEVCQLYFCKFWNSDRTKIVPELMTVSVRFSDGEVITFLADSAHLLNSQ